MCYFRRLKNGPTDAFGMNLVKENAINNIMLKSKTELTH